MQNFKKNRTYHEKESSRPVNVIERTLKKMKLMNLKRMKLMILFIKSMMMERTNLKHQVRIINERLTINVKLDIL
jgi:hypothetical protein